VHIVVVQETDWLKRGPHQQHHLMERLSLRGHQITVLDYPILRPHWPKEPIVAERSEREGARIYPNASIDVITPPTVSLQPLARPSSMLTHVRELRQIIKNQKPDLIVSYALSTGLPALRIAKQQGIPYIFHVIDALHAIVPQGFLRPIAHRFEKTIFSGAEQTLVINDHLLDYAVRMGAPKDHSRVLRTGADLKRFATEHDQETVRAKLGVSPDDFILLFMGWIYDFSGVREVAQSMRNAPDNVRLVVVGDGDDYEALKHLRDAELGEKLVLTGRVSYDLIPEFLSAADVALLPFQTVPATEHIVPIKLYEYMAASKPVIAGPLPGVMRDVGNSNGVAFAPAESQLETALALRDKGQLGDMGKRARLFVETNCDWEIITDELEKLLTDMVATQ